ncbi:hypothetical protein [Stenotrophomonas sp. PFBMAA-4]|nr:hypothetical protein [Stenotrophomonas sp. PFBMAA-4]MDI9272095.1 hypothetical protein [Stenotrophomonas sp. PFBMAA-4]
MFSDGNSIDVAFSCAENGTMPQLAAAFVPESSAFIDAWRGLIRVCHARH